MGSLDAMVDEIDRLSRRLTRNTECCDRALAARSALTASQGHTLQVLGEHGEIAMNALAEEMRLHGTTMTRMVDSLVARGLVERASDPGDRRVVRVRLSARGLAAVADLNQRRRDFLASALERVPDEDLRAITDGLRRLVRLAEEWGAGCYPR